MRKCIESSFSYSLGDAIDWKHYGYDMTDDNDDISYSLGDAIDWKQGLRSLDNLTEISPTR